MDEKEAEALVTALADIIDRFEVPMQLTADTTDSELKRLIGTLAAETISKIDYEILPHLYAKFFPKLKAIRNEI